MKIRPTFSLHPKGGAKIPIMAQLPALTEAKHYLSYR